MKGWEVGLVKLTAFGAENRKGWDQDSDAILSVFGKLSRRRPFFNVYGAMGAGAPASQQS
jgi:hypothetical protein